MFYCEILSGIWIGDVEILLNTRFIEDNDINIIFNCTQTYNFPDIKTIQKIRLPFSPSFELQSDKDLLKNNKNKLCEYIKNNIEHNNILLCCYDGKTISPLIIALFIQKYSNLDKKSIYTILLSKDNTLKLWCDIDLFD